MKGASADLISLLANSNEFVMWEAYVVTLVDGTVLNWADGDVAGPGALVENFSSNLAAYTTTSGNASIYSITVDGTYGNTLLASPQNGGNAYIERPFTGRLVRTFSTKFKVKDFASDDGCGVYVKDSAGNDVVWMVPRTAAGLDASQRARVAVGSEYVVATPASVTSDVWYQLDVTIASGIGNTVAVITRLSDGVVIQTTPFTLNHVPVVADRLRFFTDSSALTSTMLYTDIEIAGSPASTQGVAGAPTEISTPLIRRGTIRSVIGVQVDSLDLTLLCNSATLVQNTPLPQFAAAGGFDGARVQLDRYFSSSWQTAACGSVNLFTGRVSDISATGTEVKMTVNSDLELLNIQMPRNLYMAPCRHTLYDAGCGLSAAAFTVTGNTAANSTQTMVNCNLAQTAGYFDLGTIKFTSGPNANITRSIKVHTSGAITVSYPFPYAPATGDLFSAKPGCDKLMTTCNSAKFSNLANFGGTPFVPSPELSY